MVNWTRFYLIRNGPGHHEYSDGCGYVGEWENDERHGKGTYYFSNGDEYFGEWKRGRQFGKGQGSFSFENGDKYEGGYEAGIQHGHGTYTSANGDEFVGEFLDGKRHGQGTFTKKTGDRYTGEWEYDKYINKINSLKSSQQINNGTTTADQGTPSSKNPDTKVVGKPSNFEEKTNQETRDTIQPKVIKEMSDLKASKAAELNERAELLQSFPKATDIIEYSEPAKIAWTAIQVLSADYEEQFLAELDKRPEVHPDNLALEVYREFLKERPALETTEAQNTAISLRAISLKAEDEFARIVSYKNPTISSDDIAERITIKFGEQDGDRAEAFTYFEKLKSEDEAEPELSPAEIIPQKLPQKERLERMRHNFGKLDELGIEKASYQMKLSEGEIHKENELAKKLAKQRKSFFSWD